MEERYFSEKLAEWYEENKRDLPWRNTKDPYKIWLSEIILQQTRVSQGLPYYLRFVDAFPDVFTLASASEEQVLRHWQGLGYYTRARNLHKCAKAVVSRHGGVFPTNYQSLITLPGIGEYTAAAIASFAAKECVPVIDGNVFRVLSRIFGEDTAINTPQGKKLFQAKAYELIPRENPDVHNQAIMEFGAMRCTPKQPLCGQCIFAKSCIAYSRNIQHLLPIKVKSKKPRTRYFYYFVHKWQNSLLMKKRENKDIWHGLYDFFLIERSKAVQPMKLLNEHLGVNLKLSGKPDITISLDYKHVLSHQTIISKFIVLEHHGEESSMVREEPMEYFPMKKINDLPKPVLITRFLQDYNFL